MDAMIKRVNEMIDGVLCSDSNDQTSAVLSCFIEDWQVMTHTKKEFSMSRSPKNYSEKILEQVRDRVRDDVINAICDLYDEEELINEMVKKVDCKMVARGMMDEVYGAMEIAVAADGDEITWEDVEEEVMEKLMEY